jgi:uncharacterized protein YndB with AHSA1/START domain
MSSEGVTSDQSPRPRAQILETGDPYLLAVEIDISAPARKVFDILTDPNKHSEIDGSGSVKSFISGPKRLYLGSKFSMGMKIKVPYRIKNEVIVFEEDREIGWQHLMKWQWRYQLTPTSENSVRVREIFDGNTARSKRWLDLTGALKVNPVMMAKSLVRLKLLAESR